jgi:iron complex outermembrane receptor protein
MRNVPKLYRFLLTLSAVALAIPGLTSVAQAQGAEEEAIEEIITTGLRGRPRSSMDSAVPIDTFDAASIEAVAHADTVDILQTLVPSYNVGRLRYTGSRCCDHPFNSD